MASLFVTILEASAAAEGCSANHLSNQNCRCGRSEADDSNCQIGSCKENHKNTQLRIVRHNGSHDGVDESNRCMMKPMMCPTVCIRLQP